MKLKSENSMKSIYSTRYLSLKMYVNSIWRIMFLRKLDDDLLATINDHQLVD